MSRELELKKLESAAGRIYYQGNQLEAYGRTVSYQDKNPALGWGLKASRDIPAGACLGEITGLELPRGVVVGHSYTVARIDEENIVIADGVQVTNKLSLINSGFPNVYFNEKGFVVTLVPLKKGDTLYLDYGVGYTIYKNTAIIPNLDAMANFLKVHRAAIREFNEKDYCIDNLFLIRGLYYILSCPVATVAALLSTDAKTEYLQRIRGILKEKLISSCESENWFESPKYSELFLKIYEVHSQKKDYALSQFNKVLQDAVDTGNCKGICALLTLLDSHFIENGVYQIVKTICSNQVFTDEVWEKTMNPTPPSMTGEYSRNVKEMGGGI